MGRKTVDVEPLKEAINAILRDSIYSKETRQGWCDALEVVLFQSNNYKGFAYLDAASVPKGQLPGIVWVSDTKCNFDNTDNTRRFYS